MSHTGMTTGQARWTLVAIVCGWLTAAALTALARQGPTPQPEDAPPQVFSALRALRVVRAVVGSGVPRSPGSEAAARAIEQIAQSLTLASLQPELQRSFACGDHNCGHVTNVIAHKPGREPGSVLLVAHNDSVAAGPGASDDAAGVAVLLETARALATAPPLRHGITWLFTDAEETGGLGARVFAAEHPYMADLRAVINADNGGTSGQVLMYGTGPAELASVELYASAVQNPASSSLLSIGHRLLPRDSDFRVFRERGLWGLDFGYAAGEARYHTALDNVEHASRASVQQEGTLRVQGRFWPSVVQRGANGQAYRQWGMVAPGGEQRVQLEWTGPTHAPGELRVVTESAGVPPWLEPVVRARPAWAAASQSGDRTLVALRLPL